MNRQMLSLNTHTVQHVDLCVMDNAATRETLVCLCLVMSNSTLSCIKQLLMPVTSGSSLKDVVQGCPEVRLSVCYLPQTHSANKTRHTPTTA